MYRPKTKAERLEMRKIYLTGYDVQEMPEADCTVATCEENGCFFLRIFNGTAAKPVVNCRYHSAEARQGGIDSHVAARLKNQQYKAERQQAKDVAGKYCIDESKPYFEVGQNYFYNYSYDGDDYTITIKIVKRTACYVSYMRVYASGESDKVLRARVQVDQNGEYINQNYNWFRAFNKCATIEEIAAAEKAEQEEFAKATEAKRQRELLELEAIKTIDEQYPVKADDEYVIKIDWIEGLAEACKYMEERILSVAAAEKIFVMVDKARKDLPGYDKWKFEILHNGQTVADCLLL